MQQTQSVQPFTGSPFTILGETVAESLRHRPPAARLESKLPPPADGAGHAMVVSTIGRRAAGEVLPARPRRPQHHAHRALRLCQGGRPGAYRYQQTR